MKWDDFKAVKQPVITRGSLFRFPAKWPYEDVVEFTLFDAPWADSGYGFLVSSGYNSGLVLVLLPLDANISVHKPGSNWNAISTEWLQENWRKWVYDIPISKVKVCTSHRPIPRFPR